MGRVSSQNSTLRASWTDCTASSSRHYTVCDSRASSSGSTFMNTVSVEDSWFWSTLVIKFGLVNYIADRTRNTLLMYPDYSRSQISGSTYRWAGLVWLKVWKKKYATARCLLGLKKTPQKSLPCFINLDDLLQNVMLIGGGFCAKLIFTSWMERSNKHPLLAGTLCAIFRYYIRICFLFLSFRFPSFYLLHF